MIHEDGIYWLISITVAHPLATFDMFWQEDYVTRHDTVLKQGQAFHFLLMQAHIGCMCARPLPIMLTGLGGAPIQKVI